MFKNRFLLITLVAALPVTTSCGSMEPTPAVSPPTPNPTVATVSESWVRITGEADNVDSVAVAENQGWILGTTKGTHQLLVLDAETGTELRRVGRPGSTLGEFQRPNGITVTTTASGSCPSGAVFAVHDDQGVTAFDWVEIDRAVILN